MLYELRKKLQSVFLVAIILMSCLAGTCVQGMTPGQAASAVSEEVETPREINVRQAREKMEEGAFFVDVRESREWDMARIPGAVLIPLNQLQSRLNEIPDDKYIVIVCASGSRSKMGLDIVRKAGIQRSSSMSGGIQLWKQVGYPIEEWK